MPCSSTAEALQLSTQAISIITTKSFPLLVLEVLVQEHVAQYHSCSKNLFTSRDEKQMACSRYRQSSVHDTESACHADIIQVHDLLERTAARMPSFDPSIHVLPRIHVIVPPNQPGDGA